MEVGKFWLGRVRGGSKEEVKRNEQVYLFVADDKSFSHKPNLNFVKIYTTNVTAITVNNDNKVMDNDSDDHSKFFFLFFFLILLITF